MFTIITGLSQFERDLISERTKEGLKSARVRGRTKHQAGECDKGLKLYDKQNVAIQDGFAQANGYQNGTQRSPQMQIIGDLYSSLLSSRGMGQIQRCPERECVENINRFY